MLIHVSCNRGNLSLAVRCSGDGWWWLVRESYRAVCTYTWANPEEHEGKTVMRPLFHVRKDLIR